ncbi:MAG: hypothetical protein K2P85_09110, partial [Flavobacteriaceae bacterium]|nr:hypothetical protein [Flavobacteriaceae bacterium]
MKIYKKIAISLISVVTLVLLLNIGLNLWVRTKLNTILTQNNKSFYYIKYEKLDVSLINNSISVNEISVLTKKVSSDTLLKTKISGSIKSIKVTNIAILRILFNDKVEANNVIINSPKITFRTNNENKKKEEEDVVKSLKKTFSISNIYLKNAALKVVNKQSNKIIFKAYNLTIELNEVAVSKNTITEIIPFSYKNYSLKCDSIYFHDNAFYDLKSKEITATDSKLSISDFKLIPLYSRKQFVSKITAEKDLFTISSKEILINNMKWGFKDSVFFFDTKSVLLDKVTASIYRNKEPKDDLTRKKLYNSLLRDLKFNLKVDTLKIRNSNLIYEEEITFEKGSGKLFFDNFNLTATNIQSGFNKKKLPDLNIQIHCNFMKTSPLNVYWKLNVMDKTDGFRIRGNITNFDLEKLNPFTKPYVNIKTKGNFAPSLELLYSQKGSRTGNSQVALANDKLTTLVKYKINL